MQTKLDKRLESVNMKIIVVLIMQTENFQCRYRVYTSDGGFSDYLGFDNLPPLVRDWLKVRNCWAYVVPSAMVISGTEVV